MTKTIWYISKYVTPPYAAKVGARGFFLLREFVRSGYRSVLITSDSNHLASPPIFDGPRMVETIDGVDVHWLRTFKYKGARSFGRVWSWIDFEWQVMRMPKRELHRPDVLIVSSLSLLTILSGIWLRWRYGCKLVFEVRDIWPLVLVAAGKLSPRNPLIKILAAIERLGYRKADLIVGTMPNLAEHVNEVVGTARPVVCIPQGFDDATYDVRLANRTQPSGICLPVGSFIVCHAGSIGADNALETLMSSARILAIRNDLHFLILGEGYLKEKFQNETRDLENITFAAGVPKAEVREVLARADLLYFAAHKSPLMRFGQSLNKLIDYMLAGKPIVASFSGFPSMLNEAGCGSFVPAEDVDALCAEIEAYAAMPPEKRAEMGQRGRNWVLRNRTFSKLSADYLAHLGLPVKRPSGDLPGELE